MSLPAAIAADTGIDVLTHAVEAYVSILASDFTDGWAKQAVKLVFDYLEESVKEGTPLSREKCTMLQQSQVWLSLMHS